MALFSRRPSEPDRSAIAAVGIQALYAGEGWTLLSGRSSQVRGPETVVPEILVAPGDQRGLQAAIPAALRQSWRTALTGGMSLPLPDDVAAHRLVGGDWVRATASGVRAFSVTVDHSGLNVMRRALSISAPGGVAELSRVGDGPTARLHLEGFADWQDTIDADGWVARPEWSPVADFLQMHCSAAGLVSSWWVPDLKNRAVGAGPLRPEHAKGAVTAFLKGTQDLPDPQGPPGVGFADPGVTGRWLWLHEWTPFDGRPPTEAFTGAVGWVADDDGVVRCYRWPDRASVQQISVRGQDRWTTDARRRVTDSYTQVAGANGFPADWEVSG